MTVAVTTWISPTSKPDKVDRIDHVLQCVRHAHKSNLLAAIRRRFDLLAAIRRVTTRRFDVDSTINAPVRPDRAPIRPASAERDGWRPPRAATFGWLAAPRRGGGQGPHRSWTQS